MENYSSENEQGFTSNAPLIVASGVGAVAASSREQSQIQAAIISAKKFPRDENAAYVRAVRNFERASLAEDALYSFPRGSSTVTGPSVNCARELARCWGNLRYGFQTVEQTEDDVHLKGYAYDLESNTYVEVEDKFSKKIQKKNYQSGRTEWVQPDERQLRELVFKRGAILERNAVLKLMPPDLIEAAADRAKLTLKDKAAGQLKVSRDDYVKSIAKAFDGAGVSTEMLERRLGHKLNLISEEEVVELKAILKSIKDGNSKREEYFSYVGGSAGVESAGTEELNSSMSDKKKK